MSANIEVNPGKDVAWTPAEMRRRAEVIDGFNKSALAHVIQMSRDDEKAIIWRRHLLTGLAVVLTLGGLVLAGIALTVDAGVGAVVLASVFGIIGVALFLNPFQTIDRDIVYRRWSDQITAAFYLQAADLEADLATIRTASRNASAQFAALATAHGRVSAQAADALTAIVGSAAAASAEDEEEGDDQAVTTITLATPSDRTDPTGTALEVPLEVSAPDDTVFRAEGLPDGLALDTDTGTISGTPTTAQEYGVIVRAASVSARQTLTVTFTWTIEEPATEGDGTPAEQPGQPDAAEKKRPAAPPRQP